MSSPTNLGTRIREVRLAQEKSQFQLAVEAGCTPNTIGNIELGRTSPNVSLLRTIAIALGTSVSELLGETEGVA